MVGVNQAEFNSYEKLKDELCISSGIILRKHQIIVPESLREKVVNIAHEGHMGMSKRKALLREKVWFPRIDELVNRKVKSYLACQITTPVSEKEPLKMSELPRSPWKELSKDFGVAPTGTGEYLFVLYDDFSRYPIVEVIRSTSAKTVIPCLDKILSEFGIPDTIRSDNGPPFNSKEFYEFSKYLGFKHRKVTPYWPRANGKMEKFMRTIKKTIKAAIMEGKNWKQELHMFLRNYRATPYSSIKISPSMALFGRPMKVRLPEVPFHVDTEERIRVQDEKAKLKMKLQADNNRNVKTSEIKVGDMVLVKKDTTANKQQTPYNGKPCEVVERKGSGLLLQHDIHWWWGHFFQKIL
ncbi:uncharacterized protein K02A2.6-like [Xenia sp. Carnegie-2017]|uniref:uncharacterized protein K02A2.6-like n=1 Tax=Xenia sp. Carnegie-2017 TaxID=2897299 RepID=UPI001F04B926|nr:uncharacterized protein K02A2.6-like [Xenia sp. Carnegie-2017]